MMSLRFLFSFSQPNPISFPTNTPRTTFSTAVAVGATALAAGIVLSKDGLINIISPESSSFSSSLPWCSLSLGEGASVMEPRTGVSFPEVIGGSQKLLGIGFRRKSVLGLKNIDVYAFGVYADDNDLKKLLGEKYGKLSINEDILEGDVCMTVRLQILYSRLSIRSVRSAFEESVGNRLQKFGGPDNKDLLQRFTSQFKDEYKIPRGSVIELSRERGQVLRTTIDGKELGSIHSKLLCRSILDLYVGEDPFDKRAKEDIESKLASLVEK